MEEIKSYCKEIAVFKRIKELKDKMEENTIVAEGVIGFPEMISNIEGQK